jgi:hypothetical protein
MSDSTHDASLAATADGAASTAVLDINTVPPKMRAMLPGSKHGRGGARRVRHRKIKLLTRHDLDRRTHAAIAFDSLVVDIKSDLGGEVTAMQEKLIEALVGISVQVEATITHLLLGKKIDNALLCLMSSAMMRIGGRLGLQRMARDVSMPRLDEYLKEAKASGKHVVGTADEDDGADGAGEDDIVREIEDGADRGRP